MRLDRQMRAHSSQGSSSRNKTIADLFWRRATQPRHDLGVGRGVYMGNSIALSHPIKVWEERQGWAPFGFADSALSKCLAAEVASYRWLAHMSSWVFSPPFC